MDAIQIAKDIQKQGASTEQIAAVLLGLAKKEKTPPRGAHKIGTLLDVAQWIKDGREVRGNMQC